ncbi:MAG: endonuclease V [Alphaproteobacteria bacterium]|nr:endonuclease V [Alphaproteobacteria bacterium]
MSRTDLLRPATLRDATAIQRRIADLVDPRDSAAAPSRAAGLDVSANIRAADAVIHAAAVVLDWPSLALAATGGASEPAPFPYVPGYLGFREAPALAAAIASLPAEVRPDLLFVDGQGWAHPRRCGIACQIGVALDLPAIGVAKSILVGEIAGTLGPAPGDAARLVWKGETVAVALRTRARANPLFISVGHRVSLDGAVAHVRAALRGYRLPEPTRLAHLAANVRRRGG